MICSMKPCNITSKSLIIARLSESNKTAAQKVCNISYLRVLFHSLLLAVACILVNKRKENNAFMLQNLLHK